MSRGRAFWDMIWPMLVFLGCSSIVSAAMVMIGTLWFIAEKGVNPYEKVMSLLLPMELISFGVIVVVQFLFWKHDDRRFGKEQSRMAAWKSILGILIVCGAAIVGNILLSNERLNELFPAYDKILEMTFSGQSTALIVVVLGILGPLGEELTFRGLSLRRALHSMEPWRAIVLTALFFGLFHMNMIQFLYAFPLGILFGILYYKSGKLWPPAVAHMAANLIVILLF